MSDCVLGLLKALAIRPYTQLPSNVKRLFLDFDHFIKIIMMGLGYYKGCIVIGVRVHGICIRY